MTDTQSDTLLPTVCEYAGAVLRTRVLRMVSHVDEVRRGEDTEPLHQMRVWSRRSRAALDMFAACFPGKDFKIFAREVKSVTVALGAARELDVMITTLENRASELPPAQRTGVQRYIEQLKRRRQAKQKAVERAMAHLQRIDLPGALELLLQQQRIILPPDRTDSGER